MGSACSLNDTKEVKVAQKFAVLTAGLIEGYQADDLSGPYWSRLVKESVLDIKGVEYVLHEGKVRALGEICVPLSLMAKVCKATHAFADRGVDQAVELLDT